MKVTDGWGGVGWGLSKEGPYAGQPPGPLPSPSVASPEGIRLWSNAKVSQDVQ